MHIDFLERWFSARCDGDWEQTRGVTITTLDNPGWLVTIDLAAPPQRAAPPHRVLARRGDPPTAENGNLGGPDWMICELINGQFKGAGDPLKLGLILETFRQFVSTPLEP